MLPLVTAEPTNNMTVEVYLDQGELHRKDGPALVKRDARTGVIREESWYQKGGLHRGRGEPAYVERYPNGNVRTMQWYVNDVPHRNLVAGPANMEYSETGAVVLEQYYVRGTLVPRIGNVRPGGRTNPRAYAQPAPR